MQRILSCSRPSPLATRGILRLIAPELAGKTLLLLAQNFKLECAQNIVDADVFVARAMPNVAANIGASATALCYGEYFDEASREIVRALAVKIGKFYDRRGRLCRIYWDRRESACVRVRFYRGGGRGRAGRSTAGAVLRRGSDGGRGHGASATKRQATTRAQRRRLLACRHDDRGAGGAGDGGVSRSGDGGDRGVHRQSSRLASPHLVGFGFQTQRVCGRANIGILCRRSS